MRLIKAKITITIIATLTAILFIVLNTLFPKYSVMILSIEIILLPSIYIIGNYIAEELIKEDYNMIINGISEESNKLNERYFEERVVNEKLKNQIKLLNKNESK